MRVGTGFQIVVLPQRHFSLLLGCVVLKDTLSQLFVLRVNRHEVSNRTHCFKFFVAFGAIHGYSGFSIFAGLLVTSLDSNSQSGEFRRVGRRFVMKNAKEEVVTRFLAVECRMGILARAEAQEASQAHVDSLILCLWITTNEEREPMNRSNTRIPLCIRELMPSTAQSTVKTVRLQLQCHHSGNTAKGRRHAPSQLELH